MATYSPSAPLIARMMVRAMVWDGLSTLDAPTQTIVKNNLASMEFVDSRTLAIMDEAGVAGSVATSSETAPPAWLGTLLQWIITYLPYILSLFGIVVPTPPAPPTPVPA